MYKFVLNSSTGTNNNSKQIALLEAAAGNAEHISVYDVLERVGCLHEVLAISKDPNGWLMKNGLQEEFLVWVTVADIVKPVVERYHAELLFFKWTVVEWIVTNGYTFFLKNGEEVDDRSMLEYVNRYGLTTDHLPDILMSKMEQNERWNDHGGDNINEADLGKTEWHVVSVDSSFFHRVKGGVPVRISIPTRKCICLKESVREQIGLVRTMSLTSPNGNINRTRAVKTINKMIVENRIRLSKEDANDPFTISTVVNGDEALRIDALSSSWSVRASRAPILKRSVLFGVRKPVILGHNSSNMSPESYINQSTMKFLNMIGLMGFECLRINGYAGIPNLNERTSLDDVSYVHYGKLCANGRMVGQPDEAVMEENIWEPLGEMDWVLLPDRDYFLVDMYGIMLCYVN